MISVYSTDVSKPEVQAQIQQVLQSGGVILFPTETSYGLAADPRNDEAVRKIYSIKNRPMDKPLGLLASSQEQVFDICTPPPLHLYEKILKNWPGPHTYILGLRDDISLPFQSDNIAIRVSGSEIARKLAELLRFPVTATSANLSGESDLYSMQGIETYYGEVTPDLVIDAGELEVNPPSAIYDARGENFIQLR